MSKVEFSEVLRKMSIWPQPVAKLESPIRTSLHMFSESPSHYYFPSVLTISFVYCFNMCFTIVCFFFVLRVVSGCVDHSKLPQLCVTWVFKRTPGFPNLGDTFSFRHTHKHSDLSRRVSIKPPRPRPAWRGMAGRPHYHV